MVPGTPCSWSVQRCLAEVVGIARVVPLETGVDTHTHPYLRHLLIPGFELCREKHILALEQDEALIAQALRGISRNWKLCPELKNVVPSDAPRGSQDPSDRSVSTGEDDQSPMVVRLGLKEREMCLQGWSALLGERLLMKYRPISNHLNLFVLDH